MSSSFQIVWLGLINDYHFLAILTILHPSRVAQWKRAGPITQRSVDRNHALLKILNNSGC